uniref:Mitochondrial inner membrane protein OXA1L-like n=1 Tax=Crassostrea virginica TaxID=6565 RepID=A0A8B8E6X5_CRAVI|nr:mitochondrial inner membrane protein OXA1L-like [Crassostrea virginica]
MAMNRSLHCIFRHASNPHVIGASPFTKVTFHRYYSVHHCQNQPRFDILKKNWKTARCTSTLILARAKSTTGVDEILSKAASEISKDSSIIKDVVDLGKFKPELTDVASSLNALGEESLKSLGLAKFTPVGLIQQVLELIHVNLDISWFGSIVIYTVLLRLILFPIYVMSRRAMTKFMNHQENTTTMTEKIRRAQLRGDNLLVQEYKAELREYKTKHGIQAYKQFMPLGVQAAVFLPTLLALRGMAELPVESMKSGGILWFTDLTLTDPYYGLPLLTSITLMTIVKIGAENPNTTDIAKKIGIGFSGIAFLFMMNFPAALGSYWVTSNLFSLFQAFLFSIKPIQKFLGIPDPIRPENPKAKENKSFREAFREIKEESARKSKLTNEEALRDFERIHAIEMEKAGKGPVPVTYKYNPKLKRKQKDRESLKL